jgi:hypothetical protein
MAWCPHCNQDRPIQRQTFTGACQYCGRLSGSVHKPDCRGPVAGALDVCTFCNTPIFAKALTKLSYEELAAKEFQIKKDKPACFVVTATLGSPHHPLVCDMSRFRDEILSNNRLGCKFIDWYYTHGPSMAEKIRNSSFRRLLCRVFIVNPAHLVALTFLSARDKNRKKR